MSTSNGHTEDDKHAHEEGASLVGRPAKEAEPTYWETYVGWLREYLLNFRPYAIVALVLMLVFAVLWLAAYAWGMSIWTSVHKPCPRPLDTWLGVEGLIGVLGVALFGVMAGLSFRQTYNTRPTQMPDAPTSFVALVTVWLIVGVINFAWFVVGTAWVFQLGAPKLQRNATTNTCDQQLYMFTWWFITIGWGWYVLMCILGCALTACLPPPKRTELKEVTRP